LEDQEEFTQEEIEEVGHEADGQCCMVFYFEGSVLGMVKG
jgi:hypothetical protein